MALVIEAAFALPLIYAQPQRYSVIMTRYDNLNASLLARVQPDCIMFPLFAPSFDAMQLIMHLRELGYKGHVCAITAPLPAPRMVEDELRALAKGMVLDLIQFEN